MDGKIFDFGDLVEGDLIMGVDGPVKVLRAYDEHIPKRMFRLEFDGGNVIEASGNHLWYVESSLDRHFLEKRIKDGERLFSKMDPEVKVDLLELAFYDESKRVETEIYDMLAIVGGYRDEKIVNEDMANSIVRIADSIGHIMEENTKYQDIHDESVSETKMIKLYDGRRFAQQILALSNERYRRRWPIIVGQVITTEQLLELTEMDIDFPEIRAITA